MCYFVPCFPVHRHTHICCLVEDATSVSSIRQFIFGRLVRHYQTGKMLMRRVWLGVWQAYARLLC